MISVRCVVISDRCLVISDRCVVIMKNFKNKSKSESDKSLLCIWYFCEYNQIMHNSILCMIRLSLALVPYSQFSSMWGYFTDINNDGNKITQIDQ